VVICRQAAPLPVGGVDQLETAHGIGSVEAGEPVELAGRYLESGVDHAERLEQPLSQELGQRTARDPGDQHAQDVGAGVVQPRIARLVQQRNPGQCRHPFVRRRDELRVEDVLLRLVVFSTLTNGTKCVYIGMRATPKIARPPAWCRIRRRSSRVVCSAHG
jgi:hypothetical protein